MKHTFVRDLISVSSALALGTLLTLAAPSASAVGQGQLPANESGSSTGSRSGTGGSSGGGSGGGSSSLASPESCDNYSPARWVHLPIMDYIGNNDACSTWIEVQAVGAVPMKAALLTWGEPGFCPPQAAGPLTVECTGLLKPGSTWVIRPGQVPTGSRSGVLFKFSVQRLSDFGLDLVFGFDDTFADLMCDTLFYGMMGGGEYQRFRRAYYEGGLFAGIPMDLAAGWSEGGILAVEVQRDCPAGGMAGARATSKYNGIASSHPDAVYLVPGAHTYYVPLVYADEAEFDSWIYIHNAGLECASVELWLKPHDDCMSARLCELTTLAPAETIHFDLSTCVGSGWRGAGWVRASQPLAVVVDIVGHDSLMTYVGEAAELDYVFGPRGENTAGDGNQVVFGPLVYSEHEGWDTAIHVQNLSPTDTAKVKVFLLGRSGEVVTTLVDWICPRGSQTFYLAAVHDLPGDWSGSVRVESQQWNTPGATITVPPRIAGVATLTKHSDAQRTEASDAIAYSLLPERAVFDWPIGGPGGGGLESGAGLIAIPSLTRESHGAGHTTEIAVANVVPIPGFTTLAVLVYDQNGFLDYVCEDLIEKQVAHIDLQTWGFLGSGFKGSAIISAVFWEHDVFQEDGRFLRSVVGLGAVSAVRPKARRGGDIVGDTAAGTRGIPLRHADVEDEYGRLRFMPGGRSPECRGHGRPIRPE